MSEIRHERRRDFSIANSWDTKVSLKEWSQASKTLSGRDDQGSWSIETVTAPNNSYGVPHGLSKAELLPENKTHAGTIPESSTPRRKKSQVEKSAFSCPIDPVDFFRDRSRENIEQINRATKLSLLW